MNKLIPAFLLIFILIALNAQAFASQGLHCSFTDRVVEGVKSIVIDHDQVVINENVVIPLEKSEINCSNFGRQLRFDGNEQGYQVILKTCSTEAELAGILIDNIKQEVGDISCHLN